ncbi:MAG TPA: hypothetical protein VJJ98_05940, partial [Sedimentisphaerales bacterium]|nr:hypothetical protein [Sedimentisphaerales bacterium]
MKGQAAAAKNGIQIIRFILVIVILLILPPAVAQAQNWPRFRGPNGQGISHATTIPAKWTQDDYNWKITLPGTGYSSPVVW